MENLVEISLDEAKEKMLEMMCYIDKVCRDNNIKYSLAYGTLIGAIRHKGFIPWDDDMDIMLTRDNYDKLIEIIKKDDKYDFLDFDSGFILNFSKICYKNTLAIEKDKYRLKCNLLGVFVDVFPIDNLPVKEPKRHLRKISLIQHLLIYRNFNMILSPGNFLKKIAKLSLLFPLFCISRVFFTKKYLIRILKETILKYKNITTKKCGIFSDGLKEIYDKNDFKNYIDVSFENFKLMAVQNYDAILKIYYGDYMKLPPEEKRINTHTYKYYASRT
ncbi:LicD family protein [Campylobacter ureolyticus]|uniref:LicD family protein n=1 Tax=Campylobacter ureolyticus TaxID=827 RepID=UPI001FC8EB48|nr:LicD family protein [Campylobacter ureolyticus]MCZ6105126.1 LicD family protein [Campylobacter ureolyticus]MCZ6157842.1 LicD family protein [Campylobacter ureolyticus]GKH61115.1 LPS cholinephosphotransferase [Campylobacter ureolyticus]